MYQDTRGPVSAQDRDALLEAYGGRGRLGLPNGVAVGTRCLLSRDGAVYTVSEMRAGLYVLDDDPPLAEAAKRHGAPIAFAEATEQNHDFFVAVGLAARGESR